MSSIESAVPLAPGDGWIEDDDRDTFVHMGVATINALDRAAESFATDGRVWNMHDGTTDLFDWAFWERLYGPFAPGEYGMIDWGPDIYEDA